MQRDLRSSHKRSRQMTQDCDCDAPWGSTKPGDQQSSGVCGLECAWDLSWPRRVTVCLGHGGGYGIKRLGVSLRLGVISKFVLTFLIAMTQSSFILLQIDKLQRQLWEGSILFWHTVCRGGEGLADRT